MDRSSCHRASSRFGERVQVEMIALLGGGLVAGTSGSWLPPQHGYCSECSGEFSGLRID